MYTLCALRALSPVCKQIIRHSCFKNIKFIYQVFLVFINLIIVFFIWLLQHGIRDIDKLTCSCESL